MLRFKTRQLHALFLSLTFALIFCLGADVAHSAERLRFKVKLAPGLVKQPPSGRLLILMTNQTGKLEVIRVPALDFKKVWITAVETQHLSPDKPIEIDPDALAFPQPFRLAPPGDYQFMALLDPDHSYAYSGLGPNDLISNVVALRGLDPALVESPVELTLSKIVPPPAAPVDTDTVKRIRFTSPALSTFWGRPIEMRATVALPPSYKQSSKRRYPAVYVMHGFGGSDAGGWRRAPSLHKQMVEGIVPEMIYVFLDGSAPTGTHEFADSVNNGPWGHALTAEFIPHLESKFQMDATARGRLLTGHSSGGWSALWLQATYPNFFGGSWATSPDPVDFRYFLGVDLTETPPGNFYLTQKGEPRNLLRHQGKNIMSLEEFARQEQVYGDYGGQMASFEAVFSPRGDDGRPMRLFDRETGAIDPLVQKAWWRYDLSRFLRDNWKQLGSQLRGKLHVTVGTADSFHLEESVALLSKTLKELGSDATFSFVEGADHFNLYKDGLAEKIAREMYAVARPNHRR